jgi:NagD protein
MIDDAAPTSAAPTSGVPPSAAQQVIDACPPDVLARLAAVRGFVFDMDGTLVLGDQRNHGLAPLPGALELTDWLYRRGLPFVVFTNGTARPPADYARGLRQAGFKLTEAAMLTPATSAADLFQRLDFRRVLVLGGEGLREPLRAAGLEVLEPVGRPQVDAVLIGWYREFSMDGLEAACHAVWSGARVYSASQALFFATANGKALGTSRAISAMINSLTRCRIHLLGKPSLHALRCAGRRLGAKLDSVAVVGDDPALEVPMAHRAKALAIAVNSGLGGADSYAHLPAARRPHIMVTGAEELLSLCRRAALDGSGAQSTMGRPTTDSGDRAIDS